MRSRLIKGDLFSRSRNTISIGRKAIRNTNFSIRLLLLLLVYLLSQPSRALAADAIRIMPLGDSITYGVDSSDEGGYRTTLWSDLIQNGYSVNMVGSLSDGPDDIDREHEGHSGWRIDQISDHIESWLDTYQPQIILLHIGTNDILQHKDLKNAPKRLGFLVDQINTTLPGATVVIAQIIPNDENPVVDQETQTYNDEVEQIIDMKMAEGKHIQFIHMYDVVAKSDLADGIHPADSGYKRMGDAWYDALVPLLNPGKVRCFIR